MNLRFLRGGFFALLFVAFVLCFGGFALAAEEDFTFTVVTDTHLIREDDGSFRPYPSCERIAADIIAERPDFVIHCGDMIQTSYSRKNPDESIENMWDLFEGSFYNPITRAGIDVFLAKGNHDVLRNAEPIFMERWKGRTFGNGISGADVCSYYSFVHKGCMFIFVDDSKLAVSDEQTKWLEKKIAEGAKCRAVFVVMHIGLKGSKRHPHDHLQGRAADILTGAPYRLTVLSGHHHKFDLSDFGSARNIVIGAAGKKKDAMRLDVTVKGREVYLHSVHY